MTDEQKKLVNKYENEVLSFIGYYKYSFTYGNDKVRVEVGGDSGDIYRSDLRASMTLKSLINECGDEFLTIRELEKKG